MKLGVQLITSNPFATTSCSQLQLVVICRYTSQYYFILINIMQQNVIKEQPSWQLRFAQQGPAQPKRVVTIYYKLVTSNSVSPSPLFPYIPTFQMKFFRATSSEAHSKVFYNLLNTCCRVLFPLLRSVCIRPYVVWRIYGTDLMYLNTETLIVSFLYR